MKEETQLCPPKLSFVALMSPWQSPYLNDIVLACEVKPDATKAEGDRGELWDLGTLDEVLRNERNRTGRQMVPALLTCLGWIPSA